MADIEIAGQEYRCAKLSTRVQWHVSKLLLPITHGLLPLVRFSQEHPDLMLNGESMAPAVMRGVFEALSDTLHRLSHEDMDYVLDAVLDAVRWRQGQRWMPLRAAGSQALMLQDADRFDTQLTLVWEVLRESVVNFSSENVRLSQLPTTTNGLDHQEMGHQEPYQPAAA
jgi:hypothetical protein